MPLQRTSAVGLGQPFVKLSCATSEQWARENEKELRR